MSRVDPSVEKRLAWMARWSALQVPVLAGLGAGICLVVIALFLLWLHERGKRDVEGVPWRTEDVLCVGFKERIGPKNVNRYDNMLNVDGIIQIQPDDVHWMVHHRYRITFRLGKSGGFYLREARPVW